MPYIMAVDLGGTNCRFAGFTLDKGILSLHRMGKRKTAELPDTGALISACGTALDRHPRTADAFVVGMAGPVADPLKARLTNAPLEVDLTDAGERYGIRSCRIINDFTAEACACLTEAGSSAHCVLGAPGPRPAGPIGIIGAGTGLGTASLIRDSHGSWLPLPAELKSQRHTIATAAGAATMGRKKIVRYAALPFILRFKRTAKRSAITRENGTSTIAYLNVLRRDCHTSPSVRILL